VFRGVQVLVDVDIANLRFNPRGVGTSTGNCKEGGGKRGDVTAALKRMTALFGPGLPIRYYDYSFSRKSGKFVLIVQGEKGEFGSGLEIEALATQAGPRRTLVRISECVPLLQRVHR